MLSGVPAARWGGARRSSEGFTYAGILFAVVVLGLALSTAGTVWSAASQRQREAELLWVGTQYMRAIESYYVHAPSGIRHYPRSLGELVEDRRGAVMRRHLRRLYPDPMTGQISTNITAKPARFCPAVRARDAMNWLPLTATAETRSGSSSTLMPTRSARLMP